MKGVQHVTILRDISFLWSMFHIIAFLLLLFEARFSWSVTLAAGLVGGGTLLVINVLIMFWQGAGIIMRSAFFTCTIPTLLLFFLLSKYRDGRFFFLFCLSDTLCFWILQITNFLDRMAGDTYVVLLISRLIAFPAVEFLFWRYLRQPYLQLQRKLTKGWWLFAAIGATYYLLIMFTSVPVGKPMPDAEGLARIILVLILMPLTYLTVLRSLWRQMTEAQAQTELELVETRSRLAWENLRILQESSAALAQARHDILGNLGILQALGQRGDYKKLDEYLARLTQQTREIVPLKIANHPIVNAILSQGAGRAKEAGIRLGLHINIPDVLPFPDEDIAAFLMNLLDNALDAASLIPLEQPRWVEITMHVRGKYLFMEGLNACVSTPKPDKDSGRFLSHKGAGHGYGLKIMEGIAHRYQSELQIEAQDGVFVARTALLMPK